MHQSDVVMAAQQVNTKLSDSAHPLPHLSERKAFWEFNNGLHERRKDGFCFI